MSATLLRLIKHPVGWILAIFSILLPQYLPVYAEQVTLGLTPGDSNAQEHRIFMRTEGESYDYAQWIYQGTQHTFTVDNLQPGTVYYFVAKAYSGQAVSIDSNEIAYVIPDSDGDGISDEKEIDTYGTDPQNPDTDGDGMSDAQELALWGDLWNADGDQDGIINLLDNTPLFPDNRDQLNSPQYPIPVELPSPTGKTYIWREAEDANNIQHPMQVEICDSQCSGSYVRIAEGTENLYGWAEDPIGVLTYDFNVTKAGRYIIWGRVKTQHPYGRSIRDSNDGNPYALWNFYSRSFWVSMDGGPYALWNLSEFTQSQWDWELVSDLNGAVQMTYDLTEGRHTLSVWGLRPLEIIDDESSPKLDQLLITDDAHFLPMEMRFQDSRPVNIWIEAEDADIYYPMQIEEGDAHSSGQFVQVVTDTENFYGRPGNPVGAMTYQFEIPVSDSYVIWGRVKAHDQNGNALSVSVDGKSQVLWDLDITNQWTWQPIADPESKGPMVYEMTAGSHALLIQQHTSNPKIDQLLITNAIAFFD